MVVEKEKEEEAEAQRSKVTPRPFLSHAGLVGCPIPLCLGIMSACWDQHLSQGSTCNLRVCGPSGED